MRNALLYIVTSLSLVFQYCISWKAWYPGDFGFVKTPMFSWLDFEFPEPVQYLLFVIFPVSCLLFVIEKFRKYAAVVFFIAVVALVLEDVNRLQPWLWIHGILMMVWAILPAEKTITITRFTLVCMYAWSGIFKFNLNFAWTVFPYFMNGLGMKEEFFLPFEELGNYPLPLLNHFAWIIPLMEISIAVLLCSKYFKAGIYAAVVLHGFILLILGPLALKWNEVVWIWNIEIIFLVLISFGRENDLGYGIRNKPLVKRIQNVLLFLFGIAPVFCFFGWYPQNFSFHLYSGQNPEFYFYTIGRNATIVNDEKKNEWYVPGENENEWYFMSYYYAMNQTKLPPFPSVVHFKITGKKLCDCFGYNNTDSAGVIIYTYSFLATKKISQRITCRGLE